MKKKIIGVITFLIVTSATYYVISYFNKKTLYETLTILGIGNDFCITYSSQCTLSHDLGRLEISCPSSKINIIEQNSELKNGETTLKEVGRSLEYEVYENYKKYLLTFSQDTENQSNRKSLWINPACDHSIENNLISISNLMSQNQNEQ